MVSLPGKAGFAVSLLSTLSLIVGYGMPYWFSYSPSDFSVTWGLWIGCYKSDAMTMCCTYPTTPGLLKAVQALTSIGLVAVVVAGILYAIWLFMQLQTTRSCISIAVVCLTFLAGISIGVGLIIIAVKKKAIEKDILQMTIVLDTTVHWALVLVIVACAGTFISAICAIIEIGSTRRPLNLSNTNCEYCASIDH